jgi:putative tributyrin esterase
LKKSRKELAALAILLLLHGGGVLAQKEPTTSTSRTRQTLLIRDAVFHSASLGRDMHYRVLIPRGYNRGGRFPALYLLHGLYGDYQNWDIRTGLENYAANVPILVVMPDADDSWYTNSATVPADMFEDYVAKDLIPEIDRKYRTIHDGHGRAIAGLSMGGFGAIKFGLKYPELFALAGSLSGAFNGPQDLASQRPEFGAKLLEVFGSEGSRTRTENDIFLLLNPAHHGAYPYFYLACGTADFFLETNREFARQLSSRNLGYEYHETAGGHSWEYWDGALKPLLTAIEHRVPHQRHALAPRK